MDETKAIQELEDCGAYLKCWWPRCSGKSLFCSQLSLYYDIKTSEEDWQRLFKDTYIGTNPTKAKGSYLILYLSLAVVPATGDIEQSFRKYIIEKAEGFCDKYQDILGAVDINMQDHLSTMRKLFSAVIKARKQVFLIVDEYDSFVNQLLLQVNTSAADFGSSQSTTLSRKKSRF